MMEGGGVCDACPTEVKFKQPVYNSNIGFDAALHVAECDVSC